MPVLANEPNKINYPVTSAQLTNNLSLTSSHFFSPKSRLDQNRKAV